MNAMLKLARSEGHRKRLPVNPTQATGKTDLASLDKVCAAVEGRMETMEIWRKLDNMGHQSVRDRLNKLADAGRITKHIAHGGKVHWERATEHGEMVEG